MLLLELIEQDLNAAALILDLNAALTLGLNVEFQHVDSIPQEDVASAST